MFNVYLLILYFPVFLWCILLYRFCWSFTCWDVFGLSSYWMLVWLCIQGIFFIPSRLFVYVLTSPVCSVKSNASLIWLALSLNTVFDFTLLRAIVFFQIDILKCPVAVSDVSLSLWSHFAFSRFCWELGFPSALRNHLCHLTVMVVILFISSFPLECQLCGLNHNRKCINSILSKMW